MHCTLLTRQSIPPPPIKSMGMAHVKKCVPSYSQKEQGTAALAINIAAKGILHITNKTEHSYLKVGASKCLEETCS